MEVAAHVEERFRCAVEVIQSLPKKGSFQPSNDMLLRFYSLFKQASNGPCTGPRPAFWDPIGRAKYDAWHSLGDMPRHDAMESYVDELKKIVEVMPQTDEVESFTRSLGRFYEMVDLEKPPTLVRATTGKPIPTRTPSPVRDSKPATSDLPDEPRPQTPRHYVEELSDRDSDVAGDTTDEDQYADTLDHNPEMMHHPQQFQSSNINNMTAVLSALHRLQSEVSSLSSRLTNIEQSLAVLVSNRVSFHQNRPLPAQDQFSNYASLLPFRSFRIPRRIQSLIFFLLPIIASVWVARRFLKRR